MAVVAIAGGRLQLGPDTPRNHARRASWCPHGCELATTVSLSRGKAGIKRFVPATHPSSYLIGASPAERGPAEENAHSVVTSAGLTRRLPN